MAAPCSTGRPSRRTAAVPRKGTGRINRREFLQCLPQFIPFAVVADDRQWDDSTDAERCEIIDDRPRRPWECPDAHDLVCIQPGFQRRLGEGRVEVEVAIEEQVAENADVKRRQSREDRFDEGGGEHGIRQGMARIAAMAAARRAGSASMLSRRAMACSET